MTLDVLFILIGFALLVKGGDFLISGSVAIAQRAKLSPMVIGLTVIGFGTSLPELLVSSQAAWVGSSGLAIGNVAGSNIANVALILGTTALIRPLPATRMMLRVDVPFMLLGMVIFVAAAFTNGVISRPQGIAMTLTLIVFIIWEVRNSRRATKAAALARITAATANGTAQFIASGSTTQSIPAENAANNGTARPIISGSTAQSMPAGNATNSGNSAKGDTPTNASLQAAQPSAATAGSPQETTEEAAPMALWKALLLVAISLVAMVKGADLLIDGSTSIAMLLGDYFGVKPKEMERIIGLTIVAVGTSLPELFASVIAARKGQTDMAVGNIVGSVSFNILCVVGVASAITPIQDAWSPFIFDYFTMLCLGLMLLVFLRTKHLLERWEGAILLLVYILYIARTLYI